MPIYTVPELCDRRHTHVTALTFDPRICSLTLKGIYIAAQAPQPENRETNRWILILKTDTNFVQLELRLSDPIGGTITVCSAVSYMFADSDVKSLFIPIQEGMAGGDCCVFSIASARPSGSGATARVKTQVHHNYGGF